MNRPGNAWLEISIELLVKTSRTRLLANRLELSSRAGKVRLPPELVTFQAAKLFGEKWGRQDGVTIDYSTVTLFH